MARRRDGSINENCRLISPFTSLSPGGTVPFDTLPIGGRVRVMPNHACMTAAACDRSHVVDEIVDVWERTNGW